MATPLRNTNGHRRPRFVTWVMAEEDDLALCDQHVDKTLRFIPVSMAKVPIT